MKTFHFVFILSLLCFAGCATDYDVAEVAPEEHLDQEHHHSDVETCEDCEDDHGGSSEEPHHEGDSSPSGHNHGSGVRNHGTQWFFNQPWAAPFIWSKLLRDGLIFLLLAVLLFLITGRKKH